MLAPNIFQYFPPTIKAFHEYFPLRNVKFSALRKNFLSTLQLHITNL